MASEDVLERARNFVSSPDRYLKFKEADAISLSMVADLAAEVRELRERDAQRDAAEGELLTRVEELRKDKARLDFLLERCWIGSPFDVDMLGEKPISDLEDREEIDAAMGGEGGA